MNKWLEILLGLILVIIPIAIAIIYPSWGQSTIAFLKGGIVCFVALMGLLFLMLGISDLKE
jgi:ABC-type amino acid transport system permease subunit